METTSRSSDGARYDNVLRTTDDAGAVSTAERMTVAAIFADREGAREAVHQLHTDGFRETWIGLARADAVDPRDPPTPSDLGAGALAEDELTPAAGRTIAASAGTTRVESANWFMRFFGEGDESLHDALVRHGVSEADAQRAGALPSHSAIMTVDGANHPELAAQIVTQCGGRLITSGFGAMGYGTAGATSDSYATDTSATAYDDYGRYLGGAPVDESTRIQLREQRLRLDKSQLAQSSADSDRDMSPQSRDFDGPLGREDIFIERRPY